MPQFDHPIPSGAPLRCPRCGHLNPAYEHRCLRCQTRLTPTPAPQQQRLDLKPAWPKVIPFEWIAPERVAEPAGDAPGRRAAPTGAGARPGTSRTQRKQAGAGQGAARPKSAPGQLTLDLRLSGRLPVALHPGNCPEAPPASRSLRVAATTLDAALILACLVPFWLGVRAGGGPLSFEPYTLPYYGLILLWLAVFYKAFFAILNRDSPGLKLMGLRLVRFNRCPPAWSDRVQRLCAAGVTIAGLGAGLWWALLGRESLTWYDLISRTCVVEAEKAAPPERRARGQQC